MRLIALLLMLSVSLLAGCGVIESGKKIDYKSAGKLPTLEVPPDLTAPTGDNRYAVPDIAGQRQCDPVDLQQGAQRRSPAGSSDAAAQRRTKVRIERAGTERWLVVQATPQQVWPVVKDFWQENGFIINIESPETGVMETDWAENRAKIPQDVIRSTVGKVFDRPVFHRRARQVPHPPGSGQGRHDRDLHQPSRHGRSLRQR